jgi:nucleoside-diphosphate-sugar epimerase
VTLYLVTGGAGFIGSHLAEALLARGDHVRVLDDFSTGREENLAALVGGKGVEVVRGEVSDPELCARACDGVTGIFHQAAQVSVPRSIEAPERSYEVNVLGTLRLLEAARVAGVERVVYAASSAAYGETPTLPKVETMTPDPRSPYASGKLAAEHMMSVWGRVYGLRTVCLRYFNVYGPRQADDSPYTGVIAIFARALIDGRRPTIFGDGGQTRDFTFIDDVVAANLAAVAADLSPGEILNVGRGEQVSLLRLLREMAEICGVEVDPIFEPVRAGDVRDSLASIEKACRLLGWEPRTDLRGGLEQTLAWYRSRGTGR